MPSTVSCPHCNGKIVAEARIAGREVGCPHCNGRVTMPKAVVAKPATVIQPPRENVGLNPLDFLDQQASSEMPSKPATSASNAPLAKAHITIKTSAKNVGGHGTSQWRLSPSRLFAYTVVAAVLAVTWWAGMYVWFWICMGADSDSTIRSANLGFLQRSSLAVFVISWVALLVSDINGKLG